jgi:hypothetical protein
MEKEFVPYTESLDLKELGFDEKCLGYYIKNSSLWCNWLDVKFNDDPSNDKEDFVADAPLYQQAFRWFRENHGLIYSIGHIGHTNTWVYEIINMRIAGPDYGYGETYEEAELACLKKLIEIVKK